MTGPTLDEARDRVASMSLGRHGVHGVGVRRADSAIYVAYRPDGSLEQRALLKALEAVAAPHRLILEESATPEAY